MRNTPLFKIAYQFLIEVMKDLRRLVIMKQIVTYQFLIEVMKVREKIKTFFRS